MWKNLSIIDVLNNHYLAAFIGREKEINEIIDDFNSDKGTRLLLVGESGIGKSTLLDEVYRRLTQEEENERKQPFVGYYSKKESLIAESESLIYPFSIVLEKLANNAKESQQLSEKIDSTMARVKKGLLKFGKEQGIKMGVAIIQDVANKVGLKETLEVGKDIFKDIIDEKTSLMLAQQYIADHRDEARQSYIEIFKAIADEFKERRFVLIFDQFESVGKASTDFFLNFVKFLTPQERFDIIVSFRTDDTTWNDPSARKVYQDLERKMTFDLGAKKISIEGLSAEDIGKWIKQVRDISLPLVPDLKRIRENSAGLPLLLDEWIKSSKDLKDHDNIKRDKLCTQIIGLEEGLKDEEDQVRLDRMCILLYPLKDERLAKYLGMDNNNVDLVTAFVKRLNKNRIFDQDSEWFRHELVKICFEDRLGNQRRINYHQKAAKFFEGLQVQEKQGDEEDKEIIYSISISRAYHFHMAGDHKESFTYNKKLAERAYNIGDLDIAERCYKRAIDDAKHLDRTEDEMKCIFYLSRILYVWGRYKEALDNYEYLQSYCIKNNDNKLLPKVLYGLSEIWLIRGDLQRTSDLATKSLSMAIDRERKKGFSLMLSERGDIKYERKQEVLQIYDDRLSLKRPNIMERLTMGGSAFQAANTEYLEGNYVQALEGYYLVLSIPEEYNNPLILSLTIHQIADITRDQKIYDEAFSKYQVLHEDAERKNDNLSLLLIKHQLANIYCIKKNYEESERLFNESLQIAKSIGDDVSIATTLHQLGNIHYLKVKQLGALRLHNDELSVAIKFYDESLSLKRQSIRTEEIRTDNLGIAASLGQKGKALMRNNQYNEALPHILQAYQTFANYNHPDAEIAKKDLNSIEKHLGKNEYERIKREVMYI